MKFSDIESTCKRSGYETHRDIEGGISYLLIRLSNPHRWVRVLSCTPQGEVKGEGVLKSDHPQALTTREAVLKLLGVDDSSTENEGSPF